MRITRNGILDVCAVVGLVGIAISVWLNCPTLVPGVVGALLLAAALFGHMRA